MYYSLKVITHLAATGGHIHLLSVLAALVILALIILPWGLLPRHLLVVSVVSALVCALLRPLLAVSLALLLCLLSHLLPWSLVLASSPPKAVHICFEAQISLARRVSTLCQLSDYWNQTVSIQSRVVLLTESKRAFLPIGHLLPLADLIVKHLFGHLGEARLLTRDKYFAIVCLGVNEVAHVLVEVHPWQVFSKDVHIAFERKPNTYCAFVREYFNEHLVEDLTVCKSHQVN